MGKIISIISLYYICFFGSISRFISFHFRKTRNCYVNNFTKKTKMCCFLLNFKHHRTKKKRIFSLKIFRMSFFNEGIDKSRKWRNKTIVCVVSNFVVSVDSAGAGRPALWSWSKQTTWSCFVSSQLNSGYVSSKYSATPIAHKSSIV